MKNNLGKTGYFEKIYGLARQIPAGEVATYGQLARLAGLGRGARMAGWAMAGCPPDVPAHRVVHADGSLCDGSDWGPVQRRLLEAEGVPWAPGGRVDVKACRVEDGLLLFLSGQGPGEGIL